VQHGAVQPRTELLDAHPACQWTVDAVHDLRNGEPDQRKSEAPLLDRQKGKERKHSAAAREGVNRPRCGNLELCSRKGDIAESHGTQHPRIADLWQDEVYRWGRFALYAPRRKPQLAAD